MQQTKDEIQAACGELLRTVTLKPSSTYDTVFWMFFYEDNPFVMSRIKGATVLSFVVHTTFIYFYVASMKFGSLPYFGSFSINTVRLICAMLLHMQMYPDMENARKMMTFLIHNPDRFASDLLVWPGAVVFIKVITTFGAQAAAIQSILQQSDELMTIKWYSAAVVLSSLDEKLLGIVANMYGASSEGKMEDKPLELGVYQY